MFSTIFIKKQLLEEIGIISWYNSFKLNGGEMI